jgi:eukaryotic-like serine/threonine-protein kinase
MPRMPRVIGRYALFDAIGSGGMATVHFGRVVGAGGFARTVAVKRLHEGLARDPELVATMLDEARLVSRIRHPNVVPTLDVVQADGEFLVVMEYVAGESLAALMRRREGIPVPVAVHVVAGALHGLHAAHEATNERGEPLFIVHRDVSPHNLLVGIDGVTRIIDFGVARAIGRVQTTRATQLKGKLAYMAPEQIERRPIDRRSDVYAAAIVLWEALTGERLFAGETEVETMRLALEKTARPPSTIARSVSSELDEIVLRGLARNPDDRFATALEMAQALEDSIELPTPHDVGEWVRLAAKDVLDERAAKLVAIEEASGTYAIEARTRRPRALAYGLGLVGVAALVAGALYGIGRRSSVDEKPVTETSSGGAPPATRAAADVDTPPETTTEAPSVPASTRPRTKPAPTPTRTRANGAVPGPGPGTGDCDPPFSVDRDGVKIPKPGCFSR